MMRKNKEFDSVEMKNRIQDLLQKEQSGLSDRDIRERFLHELETSDDPIAVKWRRIQQRKGEKAA